jgi:hypothetical protein
VKRTTLFGSRQWQRYHIQLRRHLLFFFDIDVESDFRVADVPEMHEDDDREPVFYLDLSRCMVEIAHGYQKRPHVLRIACVETKAMQPKVEQVLIQPLPANEDTLIEWVTALRNTTSSGTRENTVLDMIKAH